MNNIENKKLQKEINELEIQENKDD